jgi:hypothetical protein
VLEPTLARTRKTWRGWGTQDHLSGLGCSCPELKLLAFGDLEPVSSASHGLKITRIFGINFDLLTDSADVNVNGTRSDEPGIAPNGIEKMVAAKDSAWVAGEVIEEPEFGGRGGRQFAAHLQLHGVGVDHNLFKADHRWGGWTFEAPQDCLDTCHKFAGGKGLCDVVVGAKFQAQDAVIFGGAGSKKDDRDCRKRRVATEPAAYIQTIAARNHDIQQKQGWSLTFRIGNKVGWSVKDAGRKPSRLKMMLNEAGNVRVVLEYKNCLTQPECPLPAAIEGTIARPHGVTFSLFHLGKQIANV